MNNINSYRIYDDKLNLLYETSIGVYEKKKDVKLMKLLNKSRFFLNVDNLRCYRIDPMFS
ncbi:hypothetical protein FNH22_07190 [Fulvivirga sp. M361]|uniref:hypothetical protein n=1 Tax=Fulvivirga sp. M361 TaxID=2594266 RepID=UPI00117A80FE|nr:hypothetical protein [Fulvivirga sp. M361]TRX60818.1 hypothetical protein FNH22_07190 [Fulvivirga sp. M361]